MVKMQTTDCMKSWGLVAILQKYNEKSVIKHGNPGLELETFLRKIDTEKNMVS